MLSSPYQTLVINTVGEPGSGKTTLSFWLCQSLKRAGIVTEFVPEVVKYECFEAAGRARVTSGRYDFRYLRQQHRLFRPLLGNVEVVVNDGAFELSYFYGQRRIAPDRLPLFRQQVDDLREQTRRMTETWFVMPKRQHPYEPDGRNETEAQALEVRRELSRFLADEFQVAARQVDNPDQRDELLEDILNRVRELREDRMGLRLPKEQA